MKIGIVLVDDHKIFREGVRNLLEHQDSIQVIGEADDGRQAIELVRKLSPQVVIMDVTMPNLNGVDATLRILEENQKVKVIALSMHSHQHLVKEMLKAGASGYLLKECAFEELVRAIHMVFDENRIYLSPEITQLMLEDYLHPHRKQNTPDSSLLTSKEKEILKLVAEGQTSEKIALNLDMSRRTVEKYRGRIMNKLKIDNLAELVKFAIREGLVNL
jgi:DNA-binding NarL/FixJ family response regulator